MFEIIKRSLLKDVYRSSSFVFLITALFSVDVSVLWILIIDHSGSFVNLLCVFSLLCPWLTNKKYVYTGHCRWNRLNDWLTHSDATFDFNSLQSVSKSVNVTETGGQIYIITFHTLYPIFTRLQAPRVLVHRRIFRAYHSSFTLRLRRQHSVLYCWICFPFHIMSAF